MPKPRMPGGLGDKAKKVWKGIVDVYELRPDELRILEDACREIDLVERLEKEISRPGAKLMMPGSMGQMVANPLVQEIRQHRAVVERLLARLKLPDEPAAAPSSRSESARAAAQARWSA